MAHRVSSNSRNSLLVGMFLVILTVFGISKASPFLVQNDYSWQSGYIKDQQNNVKNFQREISDIKRQAEGVDISIANAKLNEFSVCINNLNSKVGSDDFGNVECDQIIHDLQNYMRDNLRPYFPQ